MRAVVEAAGKGVPVLGVCNGFQVLTEAGLLPGALMRNAGLSFVCRTVGLKVESSQSIFTNGYAAGAEIALPVAHHDGNFQADAATLERIEGEGRVALRYTGEVNGSANGIAGLLNDARQCAGHDAPPRARARSRRTATRTAAACSKACSKRSPDFLIAPQTPGAGHSPDLASAHQRGRPFGLAALRAVA